jgi:hypothetical protein
MQRLRSEEIAQTRSLFDTPDLRLVVDAIISGMTPAKVWVDDTNSPRTALAWEGKCIYIAGSLEDASALHKRFTIEIKPDAVSKGLEWFKLTYSPGDWNTRLEEIFGHLVEQEMPRRTYHSLNSSCETVRPTLPKTAKLKPIDAQSHTSGKAGGLKVVNRSKRLETMCH